MRQDSPLLNPNIARSFKDADRHLGALDAGLAANLISAASDLAMILDDHGCVVDMAFSGGDLTGEGVDDWIGQALGDIVAGDSRNKVSLMLGELESGLVTRRREINFLGESGESLPMNCLAIKLGDKGRTVLFGRDMRGLSRLQQRLVTTQISMEREYTRLRQAEASYRLLFQLVGEAVLIIDVATMTVSDANPVAADLLGVAIAKMVGRRATHVFSGKDREAVRTILSSVQSVGQAEISDLGADNDVGFSLKASLFRQGDVAHILLRMLPVAQASGVSSPASDSSKVVDVIDRLPDGFVVIDEQRRVKRANGAFLELVQAASFEQVENQTIDSWFERSSVDATVLLANVREHGLVRRFPTSLRGALGSLEDIEITAVAVPSEVGQLYGMVLRRAMRAQGEDTPITGFPAQSAEQLTDLIGHMSLKEVVRETTDVVERLCIDAALKLTGDNRASAAQMLGVSRQSLYAKMRRFGLGDLAGDSDD